MGYSAEDDGDSDREKDVDVREQGAFALTRRCVTLFWTHRRLFVSILVVVVFPFKIAEEALFAGLTIVYRGVIETGMRTGADGSLDIEPRVIASTVGLLSAASLIVSVLSIIPKICVVCSVAGIVSKKAVGLADGLGAVRRRWRPVILTSFCFNATMFGAVNVAGPLMYAAYYFQSVALTVAAYLMLCVLIVYTSFVFQLGNIVSILEGAYGWKALGEARRLLRGKKWVAFKIQVQYYFLSILAEIATNWISQWIYTILGITVNPVGKAVVHTALALAIRVVVHAALTTGLCIFIVTESLLYFSCKALHQENVADLDFFQNHVIQGAYVKLHQQSLQFDV